MNKYQKAIIKHVSIELDEGATLRQIFHDEKGNHWGFSLKSVKDWLQGLPSAVNFPFANYDILQLLKAGGCSVRDEVNAVERYWHELAVIIHTAINSGYEVRDLSDVQLTRVRNDMYGNPRYVVHYLSIADKYGRALHIARSIGGKAYRGKDYGGGIVFQSYNTDDDMKRLEEAMADLGNWL